ncbi:MAG: beta-lactamase family protein [Algicola sp.]|nr:beta-lactamase family protein [Algicola sp.]
MFKYTPVMAAVLLLSACGSDGPKVTTTPVVIEDPVVTEPVYSFTNLEATMNTDLANNNAPAVSIAIMKSGELIYANAFGSKVKDGGEVVDTDTLFQIGSTTKMFTATAALQMIQDNTITLDQSLPSALPTLNLSSEHTGWNDITMHHLLTHQGGFDDFVDWEPADSLMEFALTTFPEEAGQMNPAGKFYNYSNPNWSYLGAIIEYQQQSPYAQVMEDKVFNPLGMTRSSMSYTGVKADGNYALGVSTAMVNGEVISVGAQSLEEITEPTFGKPAGGYTWSTPSEMVKMGQFILEGNTAVLSDELRLKMRTEQVDTQFGFPESYGYGLFIRPGIFVENGWLPVTVLEHGGNTSNYTSMFWILPEQDIVISILSSGDGNNFSSSMFAALDASMDLPATVTAPLEPVDHDLFASHVGQYELDVGVLEVFEEAGVLKLNIPFLEDAGITYEPILQGLAGSTFRFQFDGELFFLTFLPDQPGGQSTYIRAREFVAIRVGSAAVGAVNKAKVKSPSKIFSKPVTLN